MTSSSEERKDLVVSSSESEDTFLVLLYCIPSQSLYQSNTKRDIRWQAQSAVGETQLNKYRRTRRP